MLPRLAVHRALGAAARHIDTVRAFGTRIGRHALRDLVRRGNHDPPRIDPLSVPESVERRRGGVAAEAAHVQMSHDAVTTIGVVPSGAFDSDAAESPPSSVMSYDVPAMSAGAAASWSFQSAPAVEIRYRPVVPSNPVPLYVPTSGVATSSDRVTAPRRITSVRAVPARIPVMEVAPSDEQWSACTTSSDPLIVEVVPWEIGTESFPTEYTWL